MRKALEYCKGMCGVDDAKISHAVKRLEPIIEAMKQARILRYSTDAAFVALPYDYELISYIKSFVKKKKLLRPTLFIVIGIGGSSLGIRAVLDAVHGTLRNVMDSHLRIYFASTVDADYIFDLVQLIRNEVKKGNTVIINVISKSGTTVETITNFEILLPIIQSIDYVDWRELVVVTTDKGSPLWECAQREGFDRLEIPKKVGGRYSIFSPVGLFPLAYMGIDIDELVSGARVITEACVQASSNAIGPVSAAVLYENYVSGREIYDTFLFSIDLEFLGKWYRQMLAESIGKERTCSGKYRPIGITPTISIGSNDLHSVAQLYLDGSDVRFTTFVVVDKTTSKVSVPKIECCKSIISGNIKGKSLSSIMHALWRGASTAYEEKQRPFTVVVLPEKSAHDIGQFLQYKMLETVYVAYLFDVNPFDQPGVERYKAETRKILSNG